MLKARFDYASIIKRGRDIWLSPAEMERWMKKREVKSFHRALREHWEQSAPMMFPNDRLTLLGVTDGVPDNLTYLVWRDDEPEVWC